MNLIQNINIVSLVLYSLSMISAGASYRQAELVEIGGKNYEFIAALMSQGEARAMCKSMGGKLFEPRDEKTNREVFTQAGIKLPRATPLWIGISDDAVEGEFKYLSDDKFVNFACKGPNAFPTGCWRVAQPITENTDAAVDGELPAATVNLDCVFGTAALNGKWQTSNCNTNVQGEPLGATALATVTTGYTFGAVTTPAATIPARFGSICEKDVVAPTIAPSTTPAPTGTSDSTCLKSGITVIIGMLLLCY